MVSRFAFCVLRFGFGMTLRVVVLVRVVRAVTSETALPRSHGAMRFVIREA